jgi:hypothetical protein
MQSVYKNELVKITKHAEASRRELKAALPRFDVMAAATRYWQDLTGLSASWYYGYGSVTMSVQLGDLMPSGRYPTREYHVALLVEFIDEQLMERGMDFELDSSFDRRSLDFHWYETGTTRVHLYAYHGGNCTIKRVGTETIERPIYKMECK